MNPRTRRLLPAVEPLEPRIAPAAVAAIDLGNLDRETGFKLSGVADIDYAGASVRAAGDVNRDGFGDLIVGAYGADEGGTDRGAAYVVFGRARSFRASVPLSELDGTNGFKLSAVADKDYAGLSVSAAGDVNGDGFGDLIVGADAADEGGDNRGAAYVVFGQQDFSSTAGTLALSTLNGSNGFKLSGVADADEAGFSVRAAGDVNGDGFGDLIVGALAADEGGTDRGAAYVVFGQRDFSSTAGSLALSALDGNNGFKLSGVADRDGAAVSVSGAGDVNGDGFGDLIVGALGADEGGDNRGAAYVVFGKAGGFGASVALSALDGTNGFTLSGVADTDLAGEFVSAAGDVNGDGFGDLIVGAEHADEGGDNRGAAYVVFGKAGSFAPSVALSALDGSNGFKLSGIADKDYAGYSVSGAGDVNGDGFGDLIVGADKADEGGEDRGAAYVVFGKADFSSTAGSLALSALDGRNGFKLSGAVDFDAAGGSVSGVGDVNGDGFGDVIVGASLAVADDNTRHGAAYVVFGRGTAKVTVNAGGKSATFTDWDGDLVKIKATKGTLTRAQFHLSSPNPLTGGAHLVFVDFTGVTDGTGLTITAKRGPMGGDGHVNVGTLDASRAALGKVRIDGDLQQVDADAVTALKVYSLGQFAPDDVHGAPLRSDVRANLGALTVKTDASRVTIAAKTFGAIEAVNLEDVRLFAAGVLKPATLDRALAIESLTVSGSVHESQILAGYDATGAAFNADVTIGKVIVKGQWIATDLVAGVRAGDDGIFATGDTNEMRIPGGNAIVAKIARITVAGDVFGTPNDVQDGFGFAAEKIVALSIGQAKLPLQPGARNDTTPQLAGPTGDVRVREVAA